MASWNVFLMEFTRSNLFLFMRQSGLNEITRTTWSNWLNPWREFGVETQRFVWIAGACPRSPLIIIVLRRRGSTIQWLAFKAARIMDCCDPVTKRKCSRNSRMEIWRHRHTWSCVKQKKWFQQRLLITVLWMAQWRWVIDRNVVNDPRFFDYNDYNDYNL